MRKHGIISPHLPGLQKFGRNKLLVNSAYGDKLLSTTQTNVIHKVVEGKK
jgi:hypothetical protein